MFPECIVQMHQSELMKYTMISKHRLLTNYRNNGTLRHTDSSTWINYRKFIYQVDIKSWSTKASWLTVSEWNWSRRATAAPADVSGVANNSYNCCQYCLDLQRGQMWCGREGVYNVIILSISEVTVKWHIIGLLLICCNSHNFYIIKEL